MTPSPVPPPPASKPAGCSRGCLIALLVVGGLGLLGAVIISVVVWRAASSEEGKKVLSAMGRGVQLAQKGLNAPGVAEVQAAGCPEAMALDLDEMMEIVGSFVDGGVKHGSNGVMVMCQGVGTLPDCDTVAQAYASAPGRPQGAFVVMVKAKHQKKDQCARRYSDDGEDLGPFGDPK